MRDGDWHRGNTTSVIRDSMIGLWELLYENQLGEQDPCGLQEEKIESIHSAPSFSEAARSLTCI